MEENSRIFATETKMGEIRPTVCCGFASLNRYNMMSDKRILITGASGFIGSFLVEGALERGFETWAGIRSTSKTNYIADERIHHLPLTFSCPQTFREQLAMQKQSHGRFDYIVHCAGVTKCKDKSEFDLVNYGQTRLFIETLQELDMMPKQFIFISTLSVFGPIHEHTYEPIKENDTPQPNTAYGKSKLKAEQYLQSLPNCPYVIFRPTGVYGPREKDYFLMAKSIKSHVDTAVGYRRQDLTFVYVRDIVQAVFLAIEKAVVRRSYFLSDGQVYPNRAFSDLIQKELGVSWVLHLKFPLWVVKVISFVAEKCAKAKGTTSTLNSDKYNIMKQRNWQCDITPIREELGYIPQYDLERGVRETIAWYKEEKWL